MEKLNSEDVKSLMMALEDLIEIKVLVRQIVPDYNLNESVKLEFITKLNSLKTRLIPLFKTYLGIQLEEKGVENADELKEQVLEIIKSNTIILVSANSGKKKLKALGADARLIIATGGPLTIENYKKINPDLSDKALEGIKKKCDRIIEDLKAEKWDGKHLIMIQEIGNKTDELLLDDLIELSKTIGIKAKAFMIPSWKDMGEPEA